MNGTLICTFADGRSAALHAAADGSFRWSSADPQLARMLNAILAETPTQHREPASIATDCLAMPWAPKGEIGAFKPAAGAIETADVIQG